MICINYFWVHCYTIVKFFYEKLRPPCLEEETAAKFSELPEDVLAKIFSLLPAKQVIRLKSVQKSWNVLINDLVKTPSFVTEHLRNSAERASSSPSFVLQYYDSDYARQKRLLTLHRDGDVEINRQISDGSIVQAHCDGIVCLADPRSHAVKLRNPATGQSKPLPDPESLMHFSTAFGFGYDAVSKVYKVVKIFGLPSVFKAKVYALTNDARSAWREVEVPSRIRIFEVYAGQTDVFCGGFSYWIAGMQCSDLPPSDTPRVTMILCFDMHRERFDAVDLPRRGVGPGAPIYVQLARWRESVALFCTMPLDGGVQVWVMSRDRRSWSKHVSIGCLVGVQREPIAFSHGGDELLMVDRRCHLLSHYLVDDKCRRVFAERIDGCPRIVPYVDSFVALP